MPASALDVEGPAHELRALAHAHDAEVSPARCTPGLEADAVVADREQQAAVRLLKPDGRGGRGGVASHVGKRFLGDAQQAEGHVRVDGIRQRCDIDRDGELLPVVAPVALRPQRFGEAQLLEDRGVQLIGEAVHIVAEVREPFP